MTFASLYGPLLASAAFVAILPRVSVWASIPGILVGAWVLVQALQQPDWTLVFLQLLAGAFLATFSAAQLAVRWLESRRAGDKRRFFQS